MKEALNWWHNTLDTYGRNRFPTPKDNDDILAYYTEPAKYLCLEYGMI